MCKYYKSEVVVVSLCHLQTNSYRKQCDKRRDAVIINAAIKSRHKQPSARPFLTIIGIKHVNVSKAAAARALNFTHVR